MGAQSKLSRRNFLLAAGAGSVATAAAVVVSQSSKRGEKRAALPESGKGYRLTEHIRNYYRTAKV